MKDLYSHLQKEFDKNQKELDEILKKLEEYPEGYISKIKRKDKKYIYLKKREGHTVKSTYIGKDGSLEHQELIICLNEREFLEQTKKMLQETNDDFIVAINAVRKKHKELSQNYYYTLRAAKETKYNAKHWYRYLAKLITKEKIYLTETEISTLMNSDELTNFQKATLRVGTIEGSPVYNKVIKMNSKASFKNLKTVMEELGIDRLPETV